MATKMRLQILRETSQYIKELDDAILPEENLTTKGRYGLAQSSKHAATRVCDGRNPP